MAFCNVASAASGFMVKSNITTSETIGLKCTVVTFPFKSAGSSRLVVKAAAEEAAATPPVAAAKPPPIGPKKGTKVRILRKESYWSNTIGSVVTVDQDPNSRYPVVVRFNKVNYANVSTSNYGLDEIEEV
ncbi:hypothetical protein OSB04_023332 [Centaurea solstitialis]|uniref:Photosystem I reaction center subunit IV n=1 Tax=Centaurea solstitialis TaxID=347529 RepID=A0AA38SWD1_9ASTR|nr:hypothetical protein OSB04_023332 [Centaurea solstitialis]